uniref:Battenin n=1 Tax=Scleropages formosus TaxID=113540 RepID=A0A8C9R3N2_SCLFO
MERAQTSLNSDPEPRGRWSFWRNLSGFWLLGLCNNFAYVVMLSAAHDILHQQESHNSTSPRPLGGGGGGGGGGNGSNGNSSLYDCNPVSTAVPCVDVCSHSNRQLPAGILLFHGGNEHSGGDLCQYELWLGRALLPLAHSLFRWVRFCSLRSTANTMCFSSINAIVNPSHFFFRSVLGGWGSGTGGAGVIGAFLYSAFTQAGLSPRTTLLIMLVVPVVMTISYYFLLVFPPAFSQWQCMEEGPVRNNQERRPLMEEEEEKEAAEDEEKPDERFLEPLTFPDKVTVIRGLVKFIVPLGLVYFAEYFINQGLLELLFFPASFLSHAEQYRWYQTLYQIGVFVSRSSLFCVKIRRVWIMSVLQCVNAVLLCVAVQFHFLPNVFTVFVIIFYEGLLGGAAYINTFHFISKETGAREREFAMAAASVGDSLGIALSSPLSFFVHNYFCSR